MKNPVCQSSVSISTKTVVIINSNNIPSIHPIILTFSDIKCPNMALIIKKVVPGIDAEILRSDVKLLCIGVSSVLFGSDTFRNL